jgi:septum formation protein
LTARAGAGARARAPGRAVVLASRSPRRQEALAALGVPFETVVSRAEESLGPLPDPTDPVPVATAKALDVAATRPDAVVLAGDTIVDLDGVALGKPDGPEGAREMLRLLRGRPHLVRSAIALAATAGDEGRALTTCEVVAPVRMGDYAEADLRRYVESGEPLDCAGAYDVHRRGGALVAAVEGCFAAVVGLPLVGAATLLEGAGAGVPRDPVETCTGLYGRPCLAGSPETAGRCRPGRLVRRPR